MNTFINKTNIRNDDYVREDFRAIGNITYLPSREPAETKINADDEKYRASTTGNETAPSPHLHPILRPLPNDSSTHEQNYVHI
jgi:hypothetical protein